MQCASVPYKSVHQSSPHGGGTHPMTSPTQKQWLKLFPAASVSIKEIDWLIQHTLNFAACFFFDWHSHVSCRNLFNHCSPATHCYLWRTVLCAAVSRVKWILRPADKVQPALVVRSHPAQVLSSGPCSQPRVWWVISRGTHISWCTDGNHWV